MVAAGDLVHGRQLAVDQQHRLAASGRAVPSSSGLYGTTLPPREPASALTMTLGVASSMREASECEAKPPNTTAWIAPMRALRQHGAAWAIMGM